SDGNGSHASTLKSPSYTKSVSWQHYHVLESSQCNNATYILNNNWQQLSQLTKAEILDGNLHHARVIHRVNWAAEILKYLP
ncbi:hypothetical protein P2P95_21895, partial [Escherichia coli]|nr:hypothetical protein [Escherichia coli]